MYYMFFVYFLVYYIYFSGKLSLYSHADLRHWRDHIVFIGLGTVISLLYLGASYFLQSWLGVHYSYLINFSLAFFVLALYCGLSLVVFIQKTLLLQHYRCVIYLIHLSFLMHIGAGDFMLNLVDVLTLAVYSIMVPAFAWGLLRLINYKSRLVNLSIAMKGFPFRFFVISTIAMVLGVLLKISQ
jgi:hypothetical protein